MSRLQATFPWAIGKHRATSSRQQHTYLCPCSLPAIAIQVIWSFWMLYLEITSCCQIASYWNWKLPECPSLVNVLQYSRPLNVSQYSRRLNVLQYSRPLNFLQYFRRLNVLQYSRPFNFLQYSGSLNVLQYSRPLNVLQYSRSIWCSARTYSGSHARFKFRSVCKFCWTTQPKYKLTFALPHKIYLKGQFKVWWDHTTPERKEFYIGMGVNLGRKSGVASGTFVWLRGWKWSNRGRIAAVVFDPHPINLVLSYIHIFAPFHLIKSSSSSNFAFICSARILNLRHLFWAIKFSSNFKIYYKQWFSVIVIHHNSLYQT